MISIFVPAPLVGVATFIAFFTSLAFWGSILAVFTLLKLIPLKGTRAVCTEIIFWLALNWETTNKVLFRLLHPVSWQVDDRTRLDPSKSYLIVCNHQSWADIVILFDYFHLRTPFLRFFLKRELLYVPFIGLACWAMDFPFMKRHSREAIARNPALRYEDLETTRRACEIYRQQPVALVNFLEGTRFSEAKRVSGKSPYRHLLRPKSAGLAFTLNAMGDQFGGIIDVTLAYRPTSKSLAWSWLCGEQDNLEIHMDLLPIPAEMLAGDYEGDAEYRSRFQAWVNGIWTRKDARLERMTSSQPYSPARPAHPF